MMALLYVYGATKAI